MKQTNLFKITFICSTIVINSFTISNHINACPLNVDESFFISPQKNDCVWYYKTVNGKKYKRLYDTVSHKWVTDWILVG